MLSELEFNDLTGLTDTMDVLVDCIENDKMVHQKYKLYMDNWTKEVYPGPDEMLILNALDVEEALEQFNCDKATGPI